MLFAQGKISIEQTRAANLEKIGKNIEKTIGVQEIQFQTK